MRCNTEEEHARFQCDTTVTGNPDPEPKVSLQNIHILDLSIFV